MRRLPGRAKEWAEREEGLVTSRSVLIVLTAAISAACPARAPTRPPETALRSHEPAEPAAPEVEASPAEVLAEPAEPCRITSRVHRLGRVVVRPEGAEPFELEVRDTEVTVEPGARPGPVKVEIRGALAFRATAGPVPLRPAAVLETAVPMVRLGDRARIERARLSGGDLVGDATIAAGVTIADLPLRCEGLLVDEQTRRMTTFPVHHGDDPPWLPVGASLAVAESHGGGREVVVRFDDPTLLTLERLEPRGERARVRVAFGDGGAIEGWVGSGAIRHAEGMIGHAATGGEGEATGLTALGRRGGAYEGPALIAGGSTVYAAPGVGPWATVVADVELRVSAMPGEENVLVRQIPGLSDAGGSGLLSHAWVRRAAVTLPPSAATP